MFPVRAVFFMPVLKARTLKWFAISQFQNWEMSTLRLYTVILLIELLCRVHHVKCWAGWITSWNQDCWEKYQQPLICRWYHPYERKQRGTEESLDEGERGEWKSWLKTQYSKNEDHGIWSHHFMAYRWGNNRNSDRFYVLGLQKSL